MPKKKVSSPLMDTDNGDYLAPTNSELLALNNTNKPSIFGLVSQLAKNVEKNTPGKFRVVANPINLHFRLASISSIDEGDFGHGKKLLYATRFFSWAGFG